MEFKEFEELQEFKNGNPSQKPSTGLGRASTLHHAATPLIHDSITPFLRRLLWPCRKGRRS
jgi:hypothetical protein